jgi:two-component system OmpR family response regulator
MQSRVEELRDRHPSPARNVRETRRPYVHAMDVVLLGWPDEAARRAELRAVARPRLLLVAPDDAPPECADPLEDWIRLPADDHDVRARVATLAARSGVERPRIDADGLLWFRAQWIALPPVEALLAEVLVERFGYVARREVLHQRAWAEAPPPRNALDVHMVRLRRRLGELGLEVKTVRARGYVLQPGTTRP